MLIPQHSRTLKTMKLKRAENVKCQIVVSVFLKLSKCQVAKILFPPHLNNQRPMGLKLNVETELKY